MWARRGGHNAKIVALIRKQLSFAEIVRVPFIERGFKITSLTSEQRHSARQH